MSELIIVSHENHRRAYVWCARAGWRTLSPHHQLLERNGYVLRNNTHILKNWAHKYPSADDAQDTVLRLRHDKRKHNKRTWNRTYDPQLVGDNAGFLGVEEAFLPSGRLDWEVILGVSDRRW